MTRRWLLAVLALPLVGLAAGVLWQETGARGATSWRIPVAGYDPRDALRGRYIAFRYDWEVRGAAELCRSPAACMLCLEDMGRAVRVVPRGDDCSARIDPEVSRIDLRHAPGDGSVPLAATSRLFVSERRAPALERQLAREKMVLIAHLTPAGRLVNVRLEPAQVIREP